MSGRTIWWAKDASWWKRERVVELGEEFGALGPAVIDWLSCEAKAQNDRGRLRAGFRTLARGTFSNVEEVRAIVSFAVDNGTLDDFTDEGRTFTCRVSGWTSDQDLATAAERQRRYRARLQNGTGLANTQRERIFRRDEYQCLACEATTELVIDHIIPRSKGGSSDDDNLQTLCDQCNKDKGTSATDYRRSALRDSDGTLRPMTKVTNTGQDRTGQLIGEAKASPVERPSIVADLFAYWQTTTGHPQAKLTKDRRAKIEARLREGYTAEQIRKAIDGAARAAFVNESGKRFDDIELICRSGSKLESFIERGNGDGPSAGSVTRIGPRPQRPSAGDLIDEIRANAGAA